MNKLIVIIGPTNTGKTTYAKTLESKGYFFYSFDSYYKQLRGVNFLKRKRICIGLLLKDISRELSQNNLVVCEGTQLMEEETIKKIIELADLFSIRPTLVVNDYSLCCIIKLFKERLRNKKKKKAAMIIEQSFCIFITLCYFKIVKKNVFSFLETKSCVVIHRRTSLFKSLDIPIAPSNILSCSHMNFCARNSLFEHEVTNL